MLLQLGDSSIYVKYLQQGLRRAGYSMHQLIDVV